MQVHPLGQALRLMGSQVLKETELLIEKHQTPRASTKNTKFILLLVLPLAHLNIKDHTSLTHSN